MQAIILAGGRGERMRPFTDTSPKPMVPIAGKPLIEHQLTQLKEAGITNVVVYESYLPEVLQEHLGDGSKLGMQIEHRVMPFEAGSAGVIKDAMGKLPEGQNDAVVLFGDIFSDIDLAEMVAQHLKDRPHATIAMMEHRNPFGVASSSDGKTISRFEEKPKTFESTGVYVVSKEMGNLIPESGDFSKGAIQPMIDRGYHFYIFPHSGYWWDVRSMDVVAEIEREVSEGRISLERPQVGGSSEVK